MGESTFESRVQNRDENQFIVHLHQDNDKSRKGHTQPEDIEHRGRFVAFQCRNEVPKDCFHGLLAQPLHCVLSGFVKICSSKRWRNEPYRPTLPATGLSFRGVSPQKTRLRDVSRGLMGSRRRLGQRRLGWRARRHQVSAGYSSNLTLRVYVVYLGRRRPPDGCKPSGARPTVSDETVFILELRTAKSPPPTKHLPAERIKA